MVFTKFSIGGRNAEVFRNRKGFFSINVQAVCGPNNQIFDVVARWPDSSHDANIFENSRLRMRFENNEMGDGLLLGDSGYPARQYLITPLNNPNTAGENLFQEAQIRTRNVIDRTFGIWKRRFPVLSVGLRCHVDLTQEIIVATAIFQNMACSNNEQLPEDEQNEMNFGLDKIDPGRLNIHVNENDLTRRILINYFTNL